MSKPLKIKLPKELYAQLTYEARLMNLNPNNYATRLVTKDLSESLRGKNEIPETLNHLKALIQDTNDLIEVLTKLNQESHE